MPVVVAQVAGDHPVHGHAGLGGEEALHELDGGHLEGVQDDSLVLVDGCVAREVDEGDGLSDSWPGADDDELAGLHRVQESGGVGVGPRDAGCEFLGVEVVEDGGEEVFCEGRGLGAGWSV